MALVGEALLSGSIKVLCDKISGEFIDFLRARRLDHSLVGRLKVKLMTLNAVLNDAEEKQIVDRDVGMWLDELKHAVFEAEDLVDEIDTEVSRHKAKDQTQVWNFLSTSRKPFNYKGMNGRIEVLFNKLEDLANQKDILRLREDVVGGNVSQRTPTTSVVRDGFYTYGRDGDKDKLKDLLLLSDNESSSNFSVVPIVGMGGYEALRVIKALIEEITKKKPCDNLEMNSLEVQLREQLSGKRFLLILDDLWNENYDDWERLQILFTYGAKGSKVIVTTRSRHVAAIVHNTVPIHDLKELSDEDCWSLLEKHAFRNENPGAHPDLVEIGKQIALSLPPYGVWNVGYVSNKVLDDLLPAQRCLRAFSLSGYKNITHLPDSIGNHMHLRYIDLSYTAIKRLLDTVCTLYNLQTLLLKGCSSLVELPADMRKLIHLRHLDIGGTNIKEMPVHMGRLKSLRTLTAFVLGKSTGSSIAELRELSHLGGKISILNLQNVVGAIDALLKDKKDLNEVELSWGDVVSDDSVKERCARKISTFGKFGEANHQVLWRN
nr:putative disease resistance RPP13-like protein 1 [Malus domestica]